MRRKAILLLLVMAAALMVAGGTALAVNKVCASGTTFASPCKGTAKTRTASGNDTLIGTSGPDYIFAYSGNDNIAAGAGDDYTDGSPGNDTYSYRDGWGTDTLVDASGVDTLNLSAVSGNGTIYVRLYPEYGTAQFYNQVSGPAGERVYPSRSPLSVIEKVVGSANGYDFIYTGGQSTPCNPARVSVEPPLQTLAAATVALAAAPHPSPQATTHTLASWSAVGVGF